MDVTVRATAPSIHLRAEDASSLRLVARARADALRRGELLALEAKLSIGRAIEAETDVIRALAEAYGFDPDTSWTLTDDGTLTPTPEAAS